VRSTILRMQHIYDHLRGYWSASLPGNEGVYLTEGS